MFEYTLDDLNVTAESVSKILYREAPLAAQEMAEDNVFVSRYEKLFKMYTRFVEPFAYSRSVEMQYFRDVFADSLTYDSPIFRAAECWSRGEIFVVTIGRYIDDSITGLYERGELTDALYLDAVGTSLIENLAAKLQSDIAEKYLNYTKEEDDEKLSSEEFYAARYSPGYCGWDLSGQDELFGYLADVQLPVSITSSGMMHPRKSVSGVIVMERKDPSWNLYAACRLCRNRCGMVRRVV
ncbi:MAG: hypothetical protein LWY06_07735 [Firmicutes bacterium]|nr:hypothetical protein [Bacillota bacterium]